MAYFSDGASKTERGKGNRSTFSRKEGYEIMANEIFQDERAKTQKAYYRQRQRTYSFTNQGIISRFINKVVVNIKELTEEEIAAYQKGYYEEGNRLLIIMIYSHKIPDRILIELENENITPEELLKSTGYKDAFDNNIIFESLPIEMQRNQFYQEGYNRGYEEKKQLSKSKR